MLHPIIRDLLRDCEIFVNLRCKLCVTVTADVEQLRDQWHGTLLSSLDTGYGALYAGTLSIRHPDTSILLPLYLTP